MAFLCCGDEDQVSEVPDVGHPQKRNRCTDFSFLLFFIGFWLGLVFVAIYALIVGSPMRLIHGWDSFGNVCGHKNEKIENLPFSGLDMTGKSFVFHMNQGDPTKSVKICVKKCPRQVLSNMAEIYQFYTRTNSSLCRYDFDFSNAASVTTPPSATPQYRIESTTTPTNDTGLCPVLPVMPTRRLLYHCVPQVAITSGIAFGHSMYDFISSYVPLKKVVSDIVNSHEEMIIMGIVALIASFVSAFVIHFIANIASWVILVSISVLLVVLTAVFWIAYAQSRSMFKAFGVEKQLTFILQEDSDNQTILLMMAIFCTIATVIILWMAATMRSHVQFVVALFQETSSCIRCMPALLFQPLWTLVALLLFLFGWIIVLMALSTANNESREQRLLQVHQTGDEAVVKSSSHLSVYTLIHYKQSSWIQYMWWYLVISFIWISEFILSCQQIVIAGAVSTWYFSRDRDNLGFPILSSFRELICRHIGSVALGSFLITLLKLPRLMIQQLTSRLRQYDNQAAKTALEACSCCLWLVERFLAFLNRNAYTVVVIEGTDFCPSARIAFQTLMSNAIRVAAINSIGDFILFLGKLSVAALTAIVGIFLVRSNPSIHYWTIPVILMSCFAFWVAHCLLSVYEMVIDAMFLCYCQDMNRHDGSPGSEYYAPDSLMQFLLEDEQLTEMRARQELKQDLNDDYSTVQ